MELAIIGTLFVFGGLMLGLLLLGMLVGNMEVESEPDVEPDEQLGELEPSRPEAKESGSERATEGTREAA